MSTYSIVGFDMLPDCMHVPIHVSTPMGESLVVNQVYRYFLISLVGYDTWVDLIILGMVDFDIILGMDWHSPHQAIIDCYAKNVTLAMSGVPRVEWTGASGSYPSKDELHDYLHKVFIRPSISPWGAHVLFVRNKDGSMRMCIDYQKEQSDSEEQVSSSPYYDFFDQLQVFIDDILVYSKTEEDHNRHLRIELLRLREEKLHTKFSKCEFWLNFVAFLGHVVSKDSIRVDPAKNEAVRGWTRPTSVTEIQSFVGLVGYYRRFVQSSTNASPLTVLTHQSFQWFDEFEEFFQKLKTLLTSAPILTLPDEGVNFTIYCSASGVGLGGFRMQKGKVIAYASEAFKTHERNYPTHDL
ncbi:hypothetical protein MTR67_038681 [Solanum verrucosum]|uniref:Reverse transcriptase/retrotransposon-derived protein RNase H-like domain-containing protein n=1 Tax=Solanum verrucosum TaxID=315347 RepID=A0AAF0UGX4_SOLVR|nr:hypothetical protein MTR67_038681 [Solanum verrucosum]